MDGGGQAVCQGGALVPCPCENVLQGQPEGGLLSSYISALTTATLSVRACVQCVWWLLIVRGVAHEVMSFTQARENACAMRPQQQGPPRCIVLRMQPPFNEAARAQAGFGPEWYMPIAAASSIAPAAAPSTHAQQPATSAAVAAPSLAASTA